MNISIFLSVWCQNLWDELILKNEIKYLKTKFWEDSIFRVFTYDVSNIFYKDSNITYLEYFPIWIKNPKNIIRNIKNYIEFIKTIKWSDKIIVWWWWIFYENEVSLVSNPLKIWLFRFYIFKFFKKDIWIYGVSIEIAENSKNIYKIKKLFSFSQDIKVRNPYSQNLLSNLWIRSELIDDFVFSDNYKINKKPAFLSLDVKLFDLEVFKNIDFSWKTIWIAFRKTYLSDFTISSIIEYIVKSRWKIVFLPHSFHNDNIDSNDYIYLSQFIKEWVSIVSSMEEVYDYYKQKKIDLCLSMRLHSMILCQVYDIEYIKFNYSQKTKET